MTYIDCICSCCTPDFSNMYICTNNSKYKYSQTHDIKFVFETIENFDMHPAWYKIKQILNLFDKYSTILYMDADAGFIKFDTNVSEYISDDSDITLCKTTEGLNTGVFVIKKNDKTIQALNYALTLYDKYKDSSLYEQEALSEAFDKYSLNIEKIDDTLFNASPFTATNDTVILHLMGNIKQHLSLSHWMNYFVN